MKSEWEIRYIESSYSGRLRTFPPATAGAKAVAGVKFLTLLLLRKASPDDQNVRFSIHFSTQKRAFFMHVLKQKDILQWNLFILELNDTQKEMQDLARKFTKEEIIPVAAEYDRTGNYPWDIVKKAWSVGLLNHHIPQSVGMFFFL